MHGAVEYEREIWLCAGMQMSVGKSHRYIAIGNSAKARRWLCVLACRRHYTFEPAVEGKYCRSIEFLLLALIVSRLGTESITEIQSGN
jgi:hypothetical protein